MTDREKLAAELADVWAKLLNRKTVPYDASFVRLGGDSLLLIAMLTEVEGRYDVTLEADDILDDPTVNGVTATVLRALADDGS